LPSALDLSFLFFFALVGLSTCITDYRRENLEQCYMAISNLHAL